MNNSLNVQSEATLRLKAAMAGVELAKETQGQPGGKANLVAAEVAAGHFVAMHGADVLALLMQQEVRS